MDIIRKHRNLFSIIFVVSAVGMVIGMFASPRGAQSSLSSGVVAKVEGDEIHTTELLEALDRQMAEADRMVTQQAQKSGNNPETRKFLESYIKAQVTPDRVLQSLIQRKFMVSTAEAAGIMAPPDAVRSMIQEMDAFHDKDGRFDPVIYKQRVDRPAAFEADLAMQAQVENLRTAFFSGLSVMGTAEMDEDQRLEQKKVFEALAINPREFPEPKSVSPAEVEAFLKDPSSVGALQAYYDRNLKNFRSDEQIRAKHILIRDAEGGLKKVETVLAEIKSGKKNWDAAAKEYSSDKSNADKGGDLNYFGRGQMDPAFEQAAFALQHNGDISAPVKSSFGYHLIQLVDRKAATNKSLEEAKAEIAPKALLDMRRQQRADAWMKGWLASGKVPSAADLKKLGLSWKKLDPWSPLSGRLGTYGSVDARLQDILALGKDKPLLTQPLLEGDTWVTLRWVENQPPATKTDAMDAAVNKVNTAFQYYLQTRFEDLEKRKKIVRSEKTLSTLRAQMGQPQEG